MSAHLLDSTITGFTSGGLTGAASVILTMGIAAGAMVALIWKLMACRHPGPLGLLPPTTDEAGTRTPARWFCDRCGKSWPAVFDRERRPTPRFTGYDPTKAVQAAKRADELAAGRRTLAVQRASGVKTETRPLPMPIEPVMPATEPVPFRRRA